MRGAVADFFDRPAGLTYIAAALLALTSHRQFAEKLLSASATFPHARPGCLGLGRLFRRVGYQLLLTLEVHVDIALGDTINPPDPPSWQLPAANKPVNSLILNPKLLSCLVHRQIFCRNHIFFPKLLSEIFQNQNPKTVRLYRNYYLRHHPCQVFYLFLLNFIYFFLPLLSFCFSSWLGQYLNYTPVFHHISPFSTIFKNFGPSFARDGKWVNS